MWIENGRIREFCVLDTNIIKDFDIIDYNYNMINEKYKYKHMEQIKLTESQLREMVEHVIKESIEKGEINEGFLGNLFKAGGQQIANKASRAVNDFSQRFNSMNAQDASQQADAMDKEVEALPAQIKAQVKQYRSQLMRELNQKVREYKSKLMTNMQNKQTAATNMRNKANNYQNKANAAGDRLAAADQARYNNRGTQQTQGRMVAESKLDEAIKSAIYKTLKEAWGTNTYDYNTGEATGVSGGWQNDYRDDLSAQREAEARKRAESQRQSQQECGYFYDSDGYYCRRYPNGYVERVE